MRKWIATALVLTCAAGARAEDFKLTDGTEFTGASIGAPLADGSVIVSGEGYAARVKSELLPEYIRKRMGIETAAPKVEIPRDVIELGKFEVIEINRDANEVIYSWKIAVRNTTSEPRRLKLKFVMYDEYKFPVAEGNQKDEVIGPFKSEDFSGITSVKPALAQKASTKRVQVLW